MKRVVCTLLSVSLTIGTVWGQSASVGIFLNNALTQDANIGIYIKDLQTGEVIDTYRSRNAIPPASVMKVLTTATVLELMQADSCYKTVLEYFGTLQKGVLRGDLYIHGYGDPTLGSNKQGQAFLAQWVKAIQNAGIQSIEGCVIADLSFFDGDALNPAWLWEDAGNYYAPGIFSLAYMDNTMNVVLRSAEAGSVAQVLYTVPEVPGISFENHIRCTTTKEDCAYVHGMPYNNCRYLMGAIPSNEGQFGVKGDLPNPGLLLAQHLTQRLRNAGISVQHEAEYRSERELIPRTIIYTHASQPVGEIIAQTNQHSVNLYAEMMYRQLGSRLGEPCSLHNSETVVRQLWRNRGVDLSSATIKDGCGLAPQDAVSAEAWVQILAYMYASKQRETFYASLPTSGQSGTLRSFLYGSELAGRVHAKSGTIAGTKNYAGYIEMPNGHTWAFAVLVNSAPCKARQLQPIIEKYLLDVYRQHR